MRHGEVDGPPQMDGPLPDEVGGVGSLVCRRDVRNCFIAGTGTLASYWIKKTVLNIENKKIKLTHRQEPVPVPIPVPLHIIFSTLGIC